MHYEEKFENGQWYRRGTPNGEWEPFDKDKEILAALDGAIRVLRRYTIHVGDEADTARGGLHNARPALKRTLERLEKLEAENAKLREIVSKIAASIGNGATCSPNCTLDFMESVAEEVRLVTTNLLARVAELEETISGAWAAIMHGDIDEALQGLGDSIEAALRGGEEE